MITFFKKRIFLVFGFILLLVIGAYTYQRIINSSEMIKGEKSYVVRRQLIKDTLSLSGEIDADEKATLKFQTSGMLAWVGVKEGDLVKKYQVLASLDQRELQQNLKKYLNTFLSYRWTLDQKRDDYEHVALDDTMRRIVDKAQFDVNNAVIDVEIKDLAIKLANLSTPIAGIVTKIDVPYAGVNITPSTAEFEVVNPKTIYFSATADQNDVVRLSEGMVGQITIDSYPDNKVVGSIKKISFTPKTDETGTIYEVRIELKDDNSNNKYRLGMTGDIEFEVGQGKNILAIPDSFIKTEKDEKYVNKEINGRKIKTKIKIGDTVDSLTEVTSGLEDGDIIVN